MQFLRYGQVFCINRLLGTEIILDPSNMYVKFRYNGIYYPLCRAQKLECDYLNFRTEMEFLVDNTYDSICDISFSENYYK